MRLCMRTVVAVPALARNTLRMTSRVCSSSGSSNSSSSTSRDKDCSHESPQCKGDFPSTPATALRETVSNDMVLTFLGTAACQPSSTRGASCTALRLPSGDTWLFDVGESSQVQLQKSLLRPSKITKIFITHMHGDHTFGLPGVLCMLGSAAGDISASGNDNNACIDIYGPEGIRNMLRVTLQLSQSKIAIPHRIHELKGMLFKTQRAILDGISTTLNPEYGERVGGRDIYPDNENRYIISEDNEDASVSAAVMKHTIPCVGYVIEESRGKGSKLKIERVVDIIKRNKVALKQQYDLTNAMQISKALKKLQSGDCFTFPDGTVVNADDILDHQPARKVVLLGDTSDAGAIAPLAKGAHVLVHEATNAWFSKSDDLTLGQSKSEKIFNRTTINRGHSTPQMAGKFAKKIGAKKLILTHFSNRYDGSNDEDSVSVMDAIERMAANASGLTGEGQVIAAKDFMSIPVSR